MQRSSPPITGASCNADRIHVLRSPVNHADFADRLFAALQYALPRHTASRIVYRLMRSRRRWLRWLITRIFLAFYRVDLAAAAEPDPLAYESFNAFFTRALRAGARPIDGGATTVVSPVDGTVSQAGVLDGEELIQAKGLSYSVAELLGGDAVRAHAYLGGSFVCIYLAPRDYHRIHMPCESRLLDTLYIPGDLFSVSPATVRALPRLFARNERVLCEFETPLGRSAVVLVGAMFVGSLETVWAGEINPPPRRQLAAQRIDAGRGSSFEQGAELGRFNMGSTVILLFQPGRIRWGDILVPGASVRVGQAIGAAAAKQERAVQ